MKTNTIISDTMTLDEKLAAIDAAMATAAVNAQGQNIAQGMASAPLDLADLAECLGCQ